jgi:hypothetical protein
LFIVAILKASMVQSFEWPADLPEKGISVFLDKKTRHDDPSRLPPESQSVARKNVIEVLDILKNRGENLSLSKVIVDIDSSKSHFMDNISPCLTRSRSTSGHWVISRGRRMTKAECERLFGFHMAPPLGGTPVFASQPGSVSDREWGAMLGNSIPIPMLARVLCHALPAAGLTGRIEDVWGC